MGRSETSPPVGTKSIRCDYHSLDFARTTLFGNRINPLQLRLCLRHQPQLRPDDRCSIMSDGWFAFCFGMLPLRRTSDISFISSPTPHF
jgi:hypothetical protein